MYNPIVIIIEFETDFSNVINVPDFVLVHKQQESNQLVLGDVQIVLAQTNKTHNQRMLLFYLVDQQNL